MKTLREILLERHRGAGPALDRMRNEALALLPPRVGEPFWRLALYELFISCRRKWSALVVIWLFIALAHFCVDDRNPSAVAPRLSPEWRAQEDAVLAQFLEIEKSQRSPL
jgi:hypothetical protein